MKCPICQTPDLVMTSREGIEIDYCPQCRGVWLDRGELDKIIERSTSGETVTPYRENSGYRDRDRDGGDSHYRHHKKPKHILKEIFDF